MKRGIKSFGLSIGGAVSAVLQGGAWQSAMERRGCLSSPVLGESTKAKNDRVKPDATSVSGNSCIIGAKPSVSLSYGAYLEAKNAIFSAFICSIVSD
jgi:hypothetical protein